MAEHVTEHKDLKCVIIRVPSFATGIKSFSQMVTAYFHRFISEKIGIPQVGKQLLECCFDLWDYLSSEKHVSKYFDEEPPFQLEEALLSGSWSEGLSLYDPAKFEPPDVDFMCILKNISFSEEDQLCGDLSINENTPFVNAYLSDINLLRIWKSYLVEPVNDAVEGKICQLSSKKLKQRLHENFLKDGKFLNAMQQCDPVTDGPSLKLSRPMPDSLFHGPFFQRLFDTAIFNIWRCSDLVLAIRCEGWPHNALEWIHRKRHWPPKDVVEKILKQGFHIVAKSSPEGNFRLSFSSAEGILVENLGKLQHKVIRAFKAIIKFLVPCNPDNKEILCSYHLKTVGFWHLEKSAPETWTEDNIASHLLQMFEELVQALREKNLPMYFLRGYNLLGNVENPLELEKLSDEVEEISRDIPRLTEAIRMGSNFRFYKDYIKMIDAPVGK